MLLDLGCCALQRGTAVPGPGGSVASSLPAWMGQPHLQQSCLLRQGAVVSVGHAMALRGHGIAKLRVQNFTATDAQPIAHSLQVLLVGQKFCIRPYSSPFHKECRIHSTATRRTGGLSLVRLADEHYN